MVEYFVTKGKLVVRNREPIVVVDGEAKALSQVEFILWTSLHWNVLNKETLKAEFDMRMRKYNLNLDVSFEQTLNRLKTRELMVGKSEYLAVDALYNLVKDLYVVPIGTVNKFKRAMMFSYMFFIQGSAIKELESAGYVKRTMMHGDDGKITGMAFSTDILLYYSQQIIKDNICIFFDVNIVLKLY